MDPKQEPPPPTYDPNWAANTINKDNPGPQQYGHPPSIQQQPLYYQAPAYQQQGYYGPGSVYLAPQQQVIVSPPPENYAVLAWLTCLCCCWPLGLVAIVKSTEVNSAWRQGDFARAESSSSSAQKFSYLALGFGIVGYVICTILFFFAIAGSSHWHHY